MAILSSLDLKARMDEHKMHIYTRRIHTRKNQIKLRTCTFMKYQYTWKHLYLHTGGLAQAMGISHANAPETPQPAPNPRYKHPRCADITRLQLDHTISKAHAVYKVLLNQCATEAYVYLTLPQVKFHTHMRAVHTCTYTHTHTYPHIHM